MSKPLISVVMGSKSDYSTVIETIHLLEAFKVDYEKKIVSAHRTPEAMVTYAKEAASKGIQVIIAAAGGAAHLPGMIASLTDLPVIGIPIQSAALNGMDSLLSIVQMPAGIPVLTTAIGIPGAKNAALGALRILALNNSELTQKLAEYKQELAHSVEKSTLE